MERKTTPEIDEMEQVMEEGREAFRQGKRLLLDNPYPTTRPMRLGGYWRLGWFQERGRKAEMTDE